VRQLGAKSLLSLGLDYDTLCTQVGRQTLADVVVFLSVETRVLEAELTTTVIDLIEQGQDVLAERTMSKMEESNT
jgi:hypothetical protein